MTRCTEYYSSVCCLCFLQQRFSFIPRRNACQTPPYLLSTCTLILLYFPELPRLHVCTPFQIILNQRQSRGPAPRGKMASFDKERERDARSRGGRTRQNRPDRTRVQVRSERIVLAPYITYYIIARLHTADRVTAAVVVAAYYTFCVTQRSKEEVIYVCIKLHNNDNKEYVDIHPHNRQHGTHDGHTHPWLARTSVFSNLRPLSTCRSTCGVRPTNNSDF